MAKSLIITEKPSVAREFARILRVSGKQDGYIENDGYVITWCVGHLVEMVYPEEYDERYKKWRLEDLPFLPEDYKYNVIAKVSRQYGVVHRMLFREDIDTVYWAGDAGKEGQTIEENIRKFGGVRAGMRELRVWIDSQTEEEILRGMREAKDMSEYDNLAKSGVMRTIEDYAMGINFSRAMSVKYGRLLNDAAGTKSYTAIAVGRVMTCVLGMVVIREREIRNFVETPFYRIMGSFLPVETYADQKGDELSEQQKINAEWRAVQDSKYFASPLLYKENGFRERESAEQLIEELKTEQPFVESIEKGTVRKKAPLLFNLAELQAECAKRFKISPDETLQTVQELYERKLTTYPRTDARVLSTAVAKEILKHISPLKGYAPVEPYVERILKEGRYRGIEKTQYTDDAKITDHYAIIPTGQLSELKALGDLQRKIFDLIVRRFLSVFYPPAEYQTAKLTVKMGKESLFASAKALKEAGYLEIAGMPKGGKNGKKKRMEGEADESKEDEEEGENDNAGLLLLADWLHKGDALCGEDFFIREGKTSPPKRYTSGSMVLAMENAGQLIEDEELRAQIKGSGIGTSATRAEIIRKLVRVGYLHLSKKTQVLTPESLGEMIFEVVSMTVPALLNPKMTASWEKGLEGITQGTVDMQDYRAKLEDFIRKETLKIVTRDLTDEIRMRISPLVGKGGRGIAAKKSLGVPCPSCGGELETTPFGYGCGNYKRDGSGCRFSIGSIAGRSLTEEEVKTLVTEGHTEVLSGFTSKTGKSFSASLVFKKEEDGKVKINFDFSKNQPEILEDIKCPACGADMEITPFGYACTRHREDSDACYFAIGKIAGRSIGINDLRELLQTGRTCMIKGFTAKNKKKFNASLVLETDEEGKKKIGFDFSRNEAERIEGVQCPVCGAAIEKKSFGYGCMSYDAQNPESCRFCIGSIAGKDLTVSQVKELLTKGRTETIRGFKSKNGKRFDACIALVTDIDGKINLGFDFEHVEAKKLKEVKCPICQGDIVKTSFGFGCANYSADNPESCRFSIGSIAGIRLKEKQVKELLLKGRTEVIEGFVAKTGMKFDAPLKLTQEGQIAFDFPEKPKPAETDVPCPRCGKLLQKSQWYYSCECGFQVGHTVAKVPLSEEVMRELLTTGKTKEKVTGFTSKAGNVFDAGLKFEEERIQFVFEGG